METAESPVAPPAFTLVVIRPFYLPAHDRNYKIGDEIKDASSIAVVMASEVAGNCNKVAA